MSGNATGAIKTAAKKAGLTTGEYLERMERGMKKCTSCGGWKGLYEFGGDSSRWDGRKAKCRSCEKALWRTKSMNTGPSRIERRDGDVKQARSRINHDVEQGLRPNPNDLYCGLCGHKGEDKRHEYHHLCGYAPEHHYDVIALCSTCHHKETENGN